MAPTKIEPIGASIARCGLPQSLNTNSHGTWRPANPTEGGRCPTLRRLPGRGLGYRGQAVELFWNFNGSGLSLRTTDCARLDSTRIFEFRDPAGAVGVTSPPHCRTHGPLLRTSKNGIPDTSRRGIYVR